MYRVTLLHSNLNVFSNEILVYFTRYCGFYVLTTITITTTSTATAITTFTETITTTRTTTSLQLEPLLLLLQHDEAVGTSD